MTTLHLYLIPKFDAAYWGFGADSQNSTGLYLREYLTTVLSGVSGFDAAEYHWGGTASAVQNTDLVCYVLADQSRSIVARHSEDSLGAGGSTVWSTRSSAMISEVYLTAIEGDASRPRLLANLVFHELMHNKLDSHPSRAVISDVHAIPNGSLSHLPVNSSKRLSDGDAQAMRRGVPVTMPQYTGSF